MRRIHLFEFTDQSWYPQTFRRMQTDYLQFVVSRGAGHENLIPLFRKALEHANTSEIVDLCSGGTGPWLRLHEQLRLAGIPVTVRLTDKYPTLEAMQHWSAAAGQGIAYLAESVDATQVPAHLKGMRTLFEGFHHFKPEQACSILRDVMGQRAAIGIFEASLPPVTGPLIFLLSPLMTLLGYFFATPFIKPRSFSRFLFTYLLPLVPLVTIWDGMVSFLRVYSPQELAELVEPLSNSAYTWEIGQASTGTPLFIFTYLVGYPI